MSVDRGDLVWINFNPQAGHEQTGRRSAIVLSPKAFNDTTGFVSVCPITHTVRGWGFEVPLPDGLVFGGVILTDQIKNLDWRARRIDIAGKAPDEVVEECLDKIHTFL
ncbi:type II toxin-antitoxin system PemK/MazF family toxin [Paenibacillus puldeungensis]|uniref:Type II toxin-antitoxin system PemK/MazF family toxin n=1 Tax=Paenibacillus puldeungensis TaxID=696536 RepID=A0ABW3RVE3_9BACL